MDTLLKRVWSGSALFAKYPFGALQTLMDGLLLGDTILIKGPDTLGRFSAIILLPVLKTGSILNGKNLLPRGSKFFSFGEDPLPERDKLFWQSCRSASIP